MKNIQENDQNRFLLDLKLLSSLKSIKGKVIHLDNKANSSDINTNITNTFEVKKQNLFNNNNNLLNINLGIPGRLDFNYLPNNNNNFCQNQYFSNMSIKNQKNMYTNSIIQDPFCLLDNHLNENPHRSLLSFEEMNSKEGYNILNNTINNKFSQDSFMFLNNNNNIEDDLNKNKNNNLDAMNIFINNVNNSYTNNINNNYFNNINNFCFNSNANKINAELSFNQDKIDNFLYKKRKSDIAKQNGQKGNSSSSKNNQIKKNIFKTQKNNKDINKNRIKPKIIFNCYQSKQKSKFRRQKNKKNNFSFRCSHTNCEYAYKTLKQLQNHHYKMIPECQIDLISLLKEIYNTKLILTKCISNDIDKKKYFSELFEKSIKNISLNQYTETISGTHLDEFF
jgi:hypothetical protein